MGWVGVGVCVCVGCVCVCVCVGSKLRGPGEEPEAGCFFKLKL